MIFIEISTFFYNLLEELTRQTTSKLFNKNFNDGKTETLKVLDAGLNFTKREINHIFIKLYSFLCADRFVC